ncbi:MAG: RDD family protein [Halofilum sp. (in: g-proteobacteria)]|nr:RDD family protein [Halofilum sp. (in: g-proteobacteria)]
MEQQHVSSSAEAHPAPPGRRIAAGLVDAVAIAAIALLFLLASGQPITAVPTPGTLVLTAAIAMFYRIFTEGTARMATPGKRLLGLRVRPSEGGRLDFAVAALRGWPWWLSGALAGVDPQLVPAGALLSLAALIPIVFSAERRGLHDRMAGTRVILEGRRTEATAPQ